MAPKNTQIMETEKNKTNGNSGDTTGLSSKKWDLRETWNACIWHGGSIFDAWFNAVAAQVGSVILTLPYTLSQMGYGLGIGFQILYGAFGCWTVYLLSVLYAEASSRSKATGNLHKSHILQYHEVIGIVAGKWFGRITLGFNMVALTFACVLQLIACSSDVYYMNSKWNKREWLYLFGSLAIPSVLLPSIHNFRVVSLLGIATTTLTSIYMTVAATQHGQIDKVTHQGPKSMVQFFSGATNILFSFGSHGLCIELMEAMWKPKNYKYAYVAAVLYTYFLTVPDSVSVYWAYGDILLHNSNAFAVLPKSKMKNVAIIAMILHQYVAFMLNVNPLFLAWEKLLGKHTSGRFAVKAMCRIPVVLVIWFLALAIPFFGPINSVMGAFLISFSVYIIPSVTYMRVYWKKELEEMKNEEMRPKWKIMFVVSALVGALLYYYRKQWGKPMGTTSQHSAQRGHHATDHVSGLFGRLLSSHHHGTSSHHHGTSQDEKSVPYHAVNLLTSTIKVDAEQTDLRFCFRIISPSKHYTLQAESAIDRMDWIEKITGVIASLLCSQMPEQLPCSPMSSGHQRTASESSSLGSSSDFDHTIPEDNALQNCNLIGHRDHSGRGLQGFRTHGKLESPLELFRKVPGNNVCADCGSPEPDWASLNLGVLLCIECSGVHRNLGVHISKVRSLTLDVKVWEPSVINLFQSLGNTYANSVWEELLESERNLREDGTCGRRVTLEEEIYHVPITKPDDRDSLSTKEKFIQAKYAGKRFVHKPKPDPRAPSVASQIWDAVLENNKQLAYRLIVNSSADVNTTYEQAKANCSLLLAKAVITRRNRNTMQNDSGCSGHIQLSDSATSSPSSMTDSEDLSEVEEGLQRCSLLHLACYTGDLGMVELLLQYGAILNTPDYCGRTPLHLCISRRMIPFAKLLISRGASTAVFDGDGKTPLQRLKEMGITADEELFGLLSEPNR